jgi:hypothetical protein
MGLVAINWGRLVVININIKGGRLAAIKIAHPDSCRSFFCRAKTETYDEYSE